MSRRILSYDLGGTNVRCGVVTTDGQILSRAKTATADHARPTPQEVIKRMAGIGDEAIKQLGLTRKDIACVGIGSPGPLNSQTGMILETPNLGWRNEPLAQLLADELGIPTYLENDAVAACWGEYWKGAGRGCRSMFILTLGTGVGGGLILDGKVWKGIDDTAGHLGHMTVDPHGPVQVREDNPGSAEAMCSATSCIKAAREAARRNPNSLLASVPPEEINGKFVSDCADRGDSEAIAIFTKIGTALGILCASLANALNLERGVIGGGLAAAGEKILVPLRAELRRRALEHPGRRLQIVLAELGDNAGIIGAAGLALQRLEGQM